MTVSLDFPASAKRISSADQRYGEVLDFLIDEAAVLDQRDLNSWLSYLDPSLVYLAPVRETRLNVDGEGVASGYSHFDETYGSLAFKVKRLLDPMAWSENPGSRTRRMISNLRAFELADGEFGAITNLVVFRNRGDDTHFDIISCQRTDTLRRAEGGSFRLARSIILFDQATLNTPNLAIFL